MKPREIESEAKKKVSKIFLPSLNIFLMSDCKSIRNIMAGSRLDLKALYTLFISSVFVQSSKVESVIIVKYKMTMAGKYSKNLAFVLAST